MGMVTRTISAVLAMLLVAAVPAQDAASVVREGKHFRIVFHGADLAEEVAVLLADECLTAAEAFWPILDKLLPVRAPKPGTIHVYRSEKEFRVAEQKSPMRFRREAFTTKELEGHVWLAPELRTEFLQEIGLPQATVEGLRIVAAEQVITPLVPASDEDGWLLCVAVMGAVEAAGNAKHVPGLHPGHDRRRLEFAAQRQKGAMFRLEQLLHPKSPTDRGDLDFLHGCAAVVAQQLAAVDGSWAKKLLSKQRELKGHVHTVDRRKAAVESVLGDDWAKTEMRFAKLGKTIQPVWRVLTPLWQVGPQRSVLAGTSKASAQIRSIEPPPKGDYAISGRAELGPGDARQGFQVRFGWDEKTLVGVDIEPTEVRVSEWRDTKAQWEVRTDGKVELPAAPFAFRIEVTRSEVRVLIDELHLLTWAHGGRETHVAWELVAADRLVRFERVQIEPLVVPKK